MPLYFVTGNKNKFEEVKAVLEDVEQLDIDLPEIQHIDAKEIIRAKILEALKYKTGEFVVEDTSLYLDCLKGLPGPSIKSFMRTIGNEGLFNICEKFGNKKVEAKSIIGYVKSDCEVYFFEGSVKGKIVFPRGNFGFDWDPIFQPEGFSKTFAEMTSDEKNSISMRRFALNKLKDFLEKTN